MRNSHNISAEAAIMALVNALVEIGTIAKEADKQVTSETECSGAIIPQALTLIKLRAIEAIKHVGSMMEADIRAIDEAEILTSMPALNAVPPAIPKLSGIPQEVLLTLGIFPTTTGKIKLTVENGVIQGSAPIPADHLDCSIDTFIEIAKRCGDGFQTITVPVDFFGQILVTVRKGMVTSQQALSDNPPVSTLPGLIEIAQQEGFQIISPVTRQ